MSAEKCVFVGNIPYDAKEEDLKACFEIIGPVVSFRLVKDRDSGKPKGYGFCEFREKEYARCAIRNMNGYEFNNRPLRVDYSEKHRNVMPIPSQNQGHSLADEFAHLKPEEANYLFSVMQRYSHNSEQEFYTILKARPFLIFGLLKMMDRLNGELGRGRPLPETDGLLPIPDQPPLRDFLSRPY